MYVNCIAGAVAEERTCEEVLGIPKVAIMFLARGGMPMEVLWKAWFESVALAVPGNILAPVPPPF